MTLIQEIKTEIDHEATLERISGLMEAAPGTAEDEELNTLATLVEGYEEQHHPISPPKPIDAISFRLEQSGLL